MGCSIVSVMAAVACFTLSSPPAFPQVEVALDRSTDAPCHHHHDHHHYHHHHQHHILSSIPPKFSVRMAELMPRWRAGVGTCVVWVNLAWQDLLVMTNYKATVGACLVGSLPNSKPETHAIHDAQI
jgi:hypothetical protein